MKKKLNLLLASVATLMSASTMASAELNWQLSPYVGVDAQVRHIGFKRNFGDNVFKKNYAQGNFYAGLKFIDYLGVEVGYEQAIKKNGRTANPSGAVELGTTIPSVAGTTLYIYSQNSFQMHGPHASIIGFLPFCINDQKFALIGSVGAVSLRTKLVHQPTEFNTGILTSAEREEFRAVFRKRKTVLRAMVGLQHMMTDHAGIRASVGFEKTSKFTILNPVTRNTFNLNLRTKLKDSFNYGFGIFWQF